MKGTFLKFFFFAALALAWVPLYADHSVNINTAGIDELKTLKGIGDIIAQRIIDARPYASIEEISKVNGIGESGSKSYEDIKVHITVGSPQGAPQTEVQTEPPAAQTQHTATPSASGSALPPAITARIEGERVVMVGGGSFFTGRAYGAQGLPLAGARYIWNFGDGATAEGERVFHAYAYPGKYAVLLTAAGGQSSASDLSLVEAISAQVALTAEGDGSLAVWNKSKNDLAVGFWALESPSASLGINNRFVLPEGTLILAGEGVRFSPAILRFAGGADAKLLYPNNALAAAASPGATSPLRGERISASAKSADGFQGDTLKGDSLAREGVAFDSKVPPSVSAGSISLPEPADFAAASANSSASFPLWLSLGGLAAVLAAGVVGVWYGRKPEPVTELTAEEFEITTP